MLLSLTFVACASDQDMPAPILVSNNNANVVNEQTPAAALRLEFPKVKGGNNIIIVHDTLLNSNNGENGVNYCSEWDGDKKSNRWSCYEMYTSVDEDNAGRYNGSQTQPQYPFDLSIPANFFFTDSTGNVIDPYSNKEQGFPPPTQDNVNGGPYDHGHMCPSADRVGSDAANYQTFYLTNMQPQVHSHNAGVWSRMETQVRAWADAQSTSDTLYIVKGATIDNADQIYYTYPSGLIVPEYFYMAILSKGVNGYKAIAFWSAQHGDNPSSTPLSNYVVNIKDLQEKTGIDFFCNLPDDIEGNVENTTTDVVKLLWNLQ